MKREKREGRGEGNRGRTGIRGENGTEIKYGNRK